MPFRLPVGTPAVREPDRCTELVRADPLDLPVDAVDCFPAVLAGIAAGEPLLLSSWD